MNGRSVKEEPSNFSCAKFERKQKMRTSIARVYRSHRWDTGVYLFIGKEKV